MTIENVKTFAISPLHIFYGAGLILLVALTSLPIVSLVTVLSAVFIFRVDVYRFPLEDMWSNLNIDYSSNLITLSVHTFLRLSLTFIAYMEGQRIFPFLVYFYALSGKLVITYIRIFAEYAQQVRFEMDQKYFRISMLCHAKITSLNPSLPHLNMCNIVTISLQFGPTLPLRFT